MVMVYQVCQKFNFEGMLTTDSETKHASFAADVCGEPADLNYANGSFRVVSEWVMQHGPFREHFYVAGFPMSASFRHIQASPAGVPAMSSHEARTYDDMVDYCYNGENSVYSFICMLMTPAPEPDSCECD